LDCNLTCNLIYNLNSPLIKTRRDRTSWWQFWLQTRALTWGALDLCMVSAFSQIFLFIKNTPNFQVPGALFLRTELRDHISWQSWYLKGTNPQKMLRPGCWGRSCFQHHSCPFWKDQCG
jgi:hypothetical protein